MTTSLKWLVVGLYLPLASAHAEPISILNNTAVNIYGPDWNTALSGTNGDNGANGGTLEDGADGEDGTDAGILIVRATTVTLSGAFNFVGGSGGRGGDGGWSPSETGTSGGKGAEGGFGGGLLVRARYINCASSQFEPLTMNFAGGSGGAGGDGAEHNSGCEAVSGHGGNGGNAGLTPMLSRLSAEKIDGEETIQFIGGATGGNGGAPGQQADESIGVPANGSNGGDGGNWCSSGAGSGTIGSWGYNCSMEYITGTPGEDGDATDAEHILCGIEIVEGEMGIVPSIWPFPDTYSTAQQIPAMQLDTGWTFNDSMVGCSDAYAPTNTSGLGYRDRWWKVSPPNDGRPVTIVFNSPTTHALALYKTTSLSSVANCPISGPNSPIELSFIPDGSDYYILGETNTQLAACSLVAGYAGASCAFAQPATPTDTFSSDGVMIPSVGIDRCSSFPSNLDANGRWISVEVAPWEALEVTVEDTDLYYPVGVAFYVMCGGTTMGETESDGSIYTFYANDSAVTKRVRVLITNYAAANHPLIILGRYEL
ncbi:MAG: hypothetical protein ACR2IE_00565 [Candidatus Sumerlaeaceae bacterium]